MLTLCTHLPQKCCGLLWKRMTSTKGIHTIRAYCQQAESNSHYLRSPYSIIHHYYNDSVTLNQAQNFVKSFPRLRSVIRSELAHTLKMIKDDGHSWKEVQIFKDVLLVPPAQYRQRVELLQSLSLAQPSLYHILGMRRLMDGTVKSFRESSSRIFEGDPVEHLIQAGSTDLNLPETILQSVSDLSRRDDLMTLRQVLFCIIKHYLAHRFSEDINVVESFIDSNAFSVTLSHFWKPLNYYPGICDVLIHYLQFTFSEVQEHPLLLQVDPENSKEILQKFPSLGGTPTKEVVKLHPKLLFLPASHLECWMKLLYKHEVHQFMYTYHTTALFKSSSFSEVDGRLQTLKKLEEWEVIMLSDKLFEIIRSQKHIKRLLNIVESGQGACSLTSAYQGQAKRLSRRPNPVIVSYIASTLKLPLEETKELLAEDFHTPFGYANTKTVLRLLIDYGFTREQVVAGTIVLNLEAGVVEQALRDFHARPEAQPFAEWMENPFVLHLLTYCIKKDIPHMDIPVKKS